MKKLDEHRATSEQDYGPWVDAAALFEAEDGRLLLLVEGGYQQPLQGTWYKLEARPARPLAELLSVDNVGSGWADPSHDQKAELDEWLGVKVRWVGAV